MKIKLINPINSNYSAIEQVLTNRGIKLEDIPRYLNLTKENNLNPSLLDNIDRAIELLLAHIEKEGNEILVVVDADCDGYCSSALLLNYIWRAFPQAISKFKYALHEEKTHGIIVEEISSKTSLVIAVDSSSNEYDIHKVLHEHGIDVLIIDHHHADQISPNAIVVNNQLCDYPNKTLCGGGVLYKVLQRMDELRQTSYVNEFLDLVAVALIGDMMDLRNMETRYLIQEGIRLYTNPFLRGMREKNDYSFEKNGGDIPHCVTFYIVPLINAITRSGTMEEKRLVFESMLEWKANEKVPSTKRGHTAGEKETILEQALRICTNVKNRQTKDRDADAATLEKIIKNENLLDNKLLIIRVRDVPIRRSIAGLIANEFMSKYQRPVAILSKTEHEGRAAWMGSARGYDKSELKDFREFVENSGLVFLAQGHANAFGFGIYDDDFDNFISWSEAQLTDVKFETCYNVDYLFHASNISAKTILDLGDLKYLWGQQMDESLIGIEGLVITKNMLSLMGKGTLKIELPNNISCIKFGANADFDKLFVQEGYVKINLVGKPTINRWCGKITPQILIEDYEILSIDKYYF